ncbi:MAG: hypothetical protein ACOX6Q_02465 [Candidatus Dojkabacteria bacterium]|jgi:DNA polymerase III delta prime subunit
MTYILVDKFKRRDAFASLYSLLSKLYDRDITQYDLNTNPDIHVLDPAEQNSIGIEQVKDFQKEMLFKPFQEELQVGIIIDAEKLTIQSQNALLKLLEESSSHSVYILYVDNEKNLLPTIRSRARIKYSQGKQDDSLVELEGDILEMNILERFELVEQYSENKEKALEFLNFFDQYFRSKLDLEIKNGSIGGSRRVLESLKIVDDTRQKVLANCNRRLVLEGMVLNVLP